MKRGFKFCVGDRVVMIPDNEYERQSGGTQGTVIHCYVQDNPIYTMLPYRVEWDNGHRNSYSEFHIDFAKIKTNKDAKHFLVK